MKTLPSGDAIAFWGRATIPFLRAAGPRNLCRCLLLAGALAFSANAPAQSWQAALSRMPLRTPTTVLNRANCVNVMLNAFRSNAVVKAIVFMPGATDEISFFRRVHASLANASPTLLDAVNALTNQTFIQAAFQPPFLILHTTEDPLNVIAVVKNKSTAAKLRRLIVPIRAQFVDADWGAVDSALHRHLKVWLRPVGDSPASWHFYRHNFAACGVSQWQMLKLLALAGKTTFTVHWLTADFQPDMRQGAVPKLTVFPTNH
ncbi:MAG: hypothetical protein KGR98_06295 [Verrucomicrobia bacterium]|nr:hypothetical protein [Verrucomicrobiota bacterium]MDE3099740.1 hypothetical protein [Verrucomicrobiota bacterium]